MFKLSKFKRFVEPSILRISKRMFPETFTLISADVNVVELVVTGFPMAVQVEPAFTE